MSIQCDLPSGCGLPASVESIDQIHPICLAFAASTSPEFTLPVQFLAPSPLFYHNLSQFRDSFLSTTWSARRPNPRAISFLKTVPPIPSYFCLIHTTVESTADHVPSSMSHSAQGVSADPS